MAVFIFKNWDDELKNSLSDADRLLSLYQHPLLQLQRQHSRQPKQGIVEKTDDFVVNVDVQHFAPEDVTVKVVDKFLEVEAKHEERPDNHGFVYRYFKRRYPLPEGYNTDSIVSKLSSDGVLTVRAPKLQNEQKERVIPIIHTGPHRQVQQTAESNEENKSKL